MKGQPFALIADWHDALVAYVAGAITVVALTIRIWTIERSHRHIRALLEKRVWQRTRELERAFVMTEQVIRAVSEGIVVVDSNGHAVLLNPAARSLLGLDGDTDDTGQVRRVFDQRHSELSDTMLRQLDRVDNSEPLTVDIDVSGRRRAIEVTAATLDGPGSGSVFVIRDVTEALSLLEMKSRFVSIVSHEIRTPLTSLAGSLDLLDAGVLGPLHGRAADLISVARTSADRLVRLVNDVLDLDRLESTQAPLTRTWLTTDGLLVETLRTMQPLASKNGVCLATDSRDEPVFADHDRIVQVLLNLVHNALKFAPSSTTVVVGAHRRGDEVVFDVHDEGPGIPAADLQKIFEPFTQVDTDDDRRDTGTGLGLAICRSIVQRHGGRIWAENRTPVGSRFVFTVPDPCEEIRS